MRGQAAFEALTDAIRTREPLCLNDDRFTADEYSAADEIEMRETCILCPLRSLCDAYATEGRPAAGFWAGRKRGK
jgi:hypothetical protein